MSPAKYPPGTTTGGWRAAGRLYVVGGSCSFTIAGQTWKLSGGAFADMPGGDYQLTIEGDAPLDVVSVWELPASFWQKAED